MTSEDVLYQIAHVKYKKDVGTLYVMYERICWIQGNRDIVSVSHNYADIKSQKISSDGKPKIQLQIVLHENNATLTFQFVDSNGAQKQIEDRNLVVEYLKQILPKYGRGIDRELVEKNRLLRDNSTLFQLYKDLVTDGIVTPEEFWKVHAEPYVHKNKPTTVEQDVGISSGFLSGIQPATDGSGLTYNLTPEIIESIFRTYPSVRRKHIESVPAQMSEAEFWIKFFQSHYFHRDRLPTILDLFSDCAKADDKEMRRALERLKQKNSDVLNSVDDPGYQDNNKEYLSAPNEKQESSSSYGIHRNMIKRFNQHSIMLLNASERSADSGSSKPVGAQEGKKSKKGSAQEAEPVLNGNHIATDEPEFKKPKMADSDCTEDFSSETTQQFQKLNLTKVDRYLNGPVPDYKTDQVGSDQILQSIQAMRDYYGRWGSKPQLLDSKTAVNMLGELNPGGSMMKGSFSENTSQSLTPEVESELRHTYVALSELLRHFWSCFPTTSIALQEKLVKTHDTIKKFEQIKLQRLSDDLKRDHLDPGLILGHMHSIIEAANQKFNQWVTRRGR